MELMFRQHAELFLSISDAKSDVTEAVSFLDGLIERPGKVVDLACGGGRLLGALASWASEVVGVDVSQPFLDRARQRCVNLPNVSFRQADMLGDGIEPILAESDLIVRLYTSLGYFAPSDEATLIGRCARALNPGGKLVLDTFNSAALRFQGRWEAHSSADGVLLDEYYVINEGLGAIDAAWIYKTDRKEVVIPFSLRAFSIDELARMFNDAGLAMSLHDGFGDPWNGRSIPTSRRLVVVGHKAL